MVDTDKIAALLKRRKLTQDAAAKKAGMSPQHWNNIQGGRVGQKRGVSLKTLGRMAKALGVETKDLLK